LVIDPNDSTQSPIAHPSLITLSECQMSALVGSPAVPKGKYRILPAADPTRALEMQLGGNFKVHVANLDESRKNQIWKIVPLADTRDDTKYQIKNDMNCGILGIAKFKDDAFVNCSLHEYFWTIEPRGRSFVIANSGNEDAVLSDDTKSLHAQRIEQRPCRWLLLPANLFQPVHNYRLQFRPGEDLVLDFDPTPNILHGWKWLGHKNQRWKIINAGKGIYYLQSLHKNLYVGWETHDLCEGGKVVMSKAPYHWAITTSSSLTHQFWAATSDSPMAPLGLGDLSKDALKLSLTPTFWTLTTV